MLNSPTLVLNRSWIPINVTTVRRAVVMSFVGLVRIVDVQTFELCSFDQWLARGATNGRTVQTVDSAFDAPEVEVASFYDGIPKGSVVFSRRNLYRRDRFTCQYCGERSRAGNLTVDHVLPRSRGGKTSWENCVAACIACNTRKDNKTPEEAGMALSTQPGKPSWAPWYALSRCRSKPDSWEAFMRGGGLDDPAAEDQIP